MAEQMAVYDAHEVLDAAGVPAESLAKRIRFLIDERDELRRRLSVGQCIGMASWCIRTGRLHDAYRLLAIAQRPELAEADDA